MDQLLTYGRQKKTKRKAASRRGNMVSGDMIGRSWRKRITRTVKKAAAPVKAVAKKPVNVVKKVNPVKVVNTVQKATTKTANVVTKAGGQVASVQSMALSKAGVPSALVDKAKVFADPVNNFKPSAIIKKGSILAPMALAAFGAGGLASESGISEDDLSAISDVADNIDNGTASMSEVSDIQHLVSSDNNIQTDTAASDEAAPAMVSSTYTPRGRGTAAPAATATGTPAAVESKNATPAKESESKSGLGKYAVPLVIGAGILFLVMRNK